MGSKEKFKKNSSPSYELRNGRLFFIQFSTDTKFIEQFELSIKIAHEHHLSHKKGVRFQ